jgi:hypothetical protein
MGGNQQIGEFTLAAAIRRYFEVVLYLLIFTGFGTLASTGSPRPSYRDFCDWGAAFSWIRAGAPQPGAALRTLNQSADRRLLCIFHR